MRVSLLIGLKIVEGRPELNVMLIALDTLRSDYLGCYGHSKPTSPNIDELAERGICFANSFSHTNCTLPGFTTIMTGMYSITHDVIAHDPPVPIQSGLLTAPEIFKRLGYKTLAADNLKHMRPWLGRGYDEYRSPTDPETSPARAAAEDVERIAMALLEEYRHEDFFLFVHYWDPHQPYLPPPEHDKFYQGTEEDSRDPSNRSLKAWRSSYFMGRTYRPEITDADRIISLYEGEVHRCDASVGRLLEKLEELDISDETLVVLLSDHGEIMNEPNCTFLGQPVRFCHLDLYDNVLRTPFILYHPSRLPRGKVLEPLVQHVDVLPTILAILEEEPPTKYELEGINLLPIIDGEREETRDWIELSEHTYQAKRGVRTREWKFLRIEHASIGLSKGRALFELYNLRDDPEELKNVVDVWPEVAAELEGLLEEWTQRQISKWEKTNPFLTQPISSMGIESAKNTIMRIRRDSTLPEKVGIREQTGVSFTK